MRLYRFRVMIDDKSEAFRDIEIKSEQTFLDFHKAIKKAFGFEGSEMACFYVSDDDWGKGPEIPLADLGFGVDGETAPALMDKVYISDHIRGTRQRFIYVYDFLQHWSFLIELVAAGAPAKGKRYPLVAMSFGTPPAEGSRALALNEGILPEEENGNEHAEALDDEELDDDLGHDEEEGDDEGHGREQRGGHEELPDEFH
jgi:hypothetical protein